MGGEWRVVQKSGAVHTVRMERHGDAWEASVVGTSLHGWGRNPWGAAGDLEVRSGWASDPIVEVAPPSMPTEADAKAGHRHNVAHLVTRLATLQAGVVGAREELERAVGREFVWLVDSRGVPWGISAGGSAGGTNGRVWTGVGARLTFATRGENVGAEGIVFVLEWDTERGDKLHVFSAVFRDDAQAERWRSAYFNPGRGKGSS